MRNEITFNPEKMKRYVSADYFLKSVFKKMIQEMEEHKALEVLFTTFVLEDAAVEIKYLRA